MIYIDLNENRVRRLSFYLAMEEWVARHMDEPECFFMWQVEPSVIFGRNQDIYSEVNLDLFAGTGSISLELVSRGCKQVVSVEADRDHANFIRQCFKKLNEDRDILVRGDVFRFLKSCHQKFDFIFADPPYALEKLPDIPDLVLNGDLLQEDGIFVFEHGKNYDFSDHPRFLEHRSYGSVNFSLFR